MGHNKNLFYFYGCKTTLEIDHNIKYKILCILLVKGFKRSDDSEKNKAIPSYGNQTIGQLSINTCRVLKRNKQNIDL